MDQETQEHLAELAVKHIVVARDFSRMVLGNEEIQAFFAARGVSRAELERVAESTDEVSKFFYNDPRPA